MTVAMACFLDGSCPTAYEKELQRAVMREESDHHDRICSNDGTYHHSPYSTVTQPEVPVSNGTLTVYGVVDAF